LERLSPTPAEILITADGCTDDTVQVVKSVLPQARLIINEQGLGSVASRDRMMREAIGDLVFSLDDDSYPEQNDCITRITPLFEQRQKLAVLHFPQRTDEIPETLSKTDFGHARLTRYFANSGAVLRRSIYLQLPGFEPYFFHAYEEPDYAVQCAGAGYEVMFTPAVTVRHHYSKQERNEIRTHHRHSRNELWSVVLRCPFPYCMALAIYRVFSQFRYACKRGVAWAIREPAWWASAIAGLPHCVGKRRPISLERYRSWLRMSSETVGT
jgi:GT2 family glycosyltransferase